MSLYVEESGTPRAPTIVFVHGVGASGWMWWQQIPAFSDFHCLTIDVPGHGKSSHVAWVSLADTAQHIAEVIQSRATNRRAHVVGLSLGGYIALELLKNHAAQVERAVISGVAAAPLSNSFLLRPQLWMMSIMKKRWFASRQAKALGLPQDIQSAFTENLSIMSIKTYRRILEEVIDYQVSPELRHVPVPTLITAGGTESKSILQAVEVIPAMMPHAEGRIAQGGRHGWNVQLPDLFNATLRAWIHQTALPNGLARLTKSVA